MESSRLEHTLKSLAEHEMSAEFRTKMLNAIDEAASTLQPPKKSRAYHKRLWLGSGFGATAAAVIVAGIWLMNPMGATSLPSSGADTFGATSSSTAQQSNVHQTASASGKAGTGTSQTAETGQKAGVGQAVGKDEAVGTGQRAGTGQNEGAGHKAETGESAPAQASSQTAGSNQMKSNNTNTSAVTTHGAVYGQQAGQHTADQTSKTQSASKGSDTQPQTGGGAPTTQNAPGEITSGAGIINRPHSGSEASTAANSASSQTDVQSSLSTGTDASGTQVNQSATVDLPNVFSWNQMTYVVTSQAVRQPGPRIGIYEHYNLYDVSGAKQNDDVVIYDGSKYWMAVAVKS